MKSMHRYVLSTNARDEAAIAEFVVYHLAIGFDFVLVVDHLSALPVEESLSGLPPDVLDRVRVVRQGDGGRKKEWVNEHVLPFVRSSCSGYHMHLDADEYLRLRPGIATVHDLVEHVCAKLGAAPEILLLHWRMFGSGGLDRNPSPRGDLLPTYTSCSSVLDVTFKSLVGRPVFADGRYEYQHPHWNVGPYKHANLNGVCEFGARLRWLTDAEIMEKFADRRRPEDAEACLHHYVNQCREVFMARKVLRARDDCDAFRELDVEAELLKDNEETCDELAVLYEAMVRPVLDAADAARKDTPRGQGALVRKDADAVPYAFVGAFGPVAAYGAVGAYCTNMSACAKVAVAAVDADRSVIDRWGPPTVYRSL